MNKNRVPKAQWKKWSDKAHEMFNDIYEMVYDNQRLITHPKMTQVSPAHWKTVAWNTAWLAADKLDGRF